VAENNDDRRVAIACQGSGSHTPFTAGVLKKLLKEKVEGKYDYEVVALSGTSGGAICALLAWYSLLMNDANRAVELLDSFWRDNSASSLQEKFVNDWLLWTNWFFENTGGMPTISPYYYPSGGAGSAEEHAGKARRFRKSQRARKTVEPDVAHRRR
jgi:NTE family protein